jgi:hypothetical protein
VVNCLLLSEIRVVLKLGLVAKFTFKSTKCT